MLEISRFSHKVHNSYKMSAYPLYYGGSYVKWYFILHV